MENKKKNPCANPCECNLCAEDILETIALEEAALAHILNAEGEKIQYAVASNTPIDELLKLNETVAKVIANTTHLEIVLTDKLQAALHCPPCRPRPEACEGSVKVKVVDCKCKEPLAGVYVEIRTESKIVAAGETDRNGCYCACLDCDCYQVILKCGGQCVAEEVELSCHNPDVCIEKCFHFSPEPCCCETIVCGIVRDKCGVPLKDAVITDGCRQLAKTDLCGVYVFKILPQKLLCLTAYLGNRCSQECCLQDLECTTYKANFVIC